MRALALAALAVVALARPAELVFVRHAETQANATGRYNSRTINTFSDLGEKQVVSLTQRLQGRRFDAILVSPSERVLRTIAPYLRNNHLRAVVWPDLYECCDAHTRKVKDGGKLAYGAKITIPGDLVGLFIIERAHDRLPAAASYDEGLRQIRACADRLRQDFGGTPKSVLVVGHSLMGGRLLELMQGKPMVGKIRPANTSITSLHFGKH